MGLCGRGNVRQSFRHYSVPGVDNHLLDLFLHKKFKFPTLKEAEQPLFTSYSTFWLDHWGIILKCRPGSFHCNLATKSKPLGISLQMVNYYLLGQLEARHSYSQSAPLCCSKG